MDGGDGGAGRDGRRMASIAAFAYLDLVSDVLALRSYFQSSSAHGVRLADLSVLTASSARLLRARTVTVKHRAWRLPDALSLCVAHVRVSVVCGRGALCLRCAQPGRDRSVRHRRALVLFPVPGHHGRIEFAHRRVRRVQRAHPRGHLLLRSGACCFGGQRRRRLPLLLLLLLHDAAPAPHDAARLVPGRAVAGAAAAPSSSWESQCAHPIHPSCA